jgi:FAD/FMN-containing dehydrogenase
MEVAAIRRFNAEVQPELLQHPADGSHGGVIKDSSGYAVSTFAQTQELVDLLVGSEGTLAVFTAVELALIPVTGATATMFVSFRDLARAVQAAVAAREHGAAACELLDRTFLVIAAKSDRGLTLPVHPNAEAALLIEVEADDASDAMSRVEHLRSLFGAMGATDSIVAGGSHGSDADIWAFRHAASPALARLDPALRSMQFIEDAAVPPENLAAYVRGVREILDRHETTGVIFGHAGDAHVHVNPLVDVNRPDWRGRVEAILLEVTDLVAALGGTLTGEHGDGRLRTPLLDRVWSGKERELFALLKRTFDPNGVLNPGVKVPVSGQKALDAIKYDPELADLPPSARAALQVVERERAYARHRLDLV